MTTAPSNPSDTAPGTAPLEKSRARSTQAREGLAAARTKLSDVDSQLGRNAAQTSSDETALRSAMDEVKRLKKALKDGEKLRRKLLSARKRAADAAARAEEKARKAEAKYDRAVLADMIRREKQQDRETASTKAPENGSPATTAAPPALPAATGDVQSEDLGTATARATAARATARAAADGDPAASRSTTARRAAAPRSNASPRPRSPRSTASTPSTES